MMERLTKYKFGNIVSEKQEKAGIHCSNFCNNCSQGTGDCKHLKSMIEKLAAYEDAEEQGLLLKLPCRVGDKIYRFWYVDNVPYRVQMQAIKTLSNLVAIMESGELGKTVFLTQAEAEQKLKEMKP